MIDRSEEDEILERLLDNLDLEDGRKEAFDGGLGEAKVTLIDYTLSRARVNDFVGHTAHFDFEDETIFEGKRVSPEVVPNLQVIINSTFIGRCVPSFQMERDLHGGSTDRLPTFCGYITSQISCCMLNSYLLQ